MEEVVGEVEFVEEFVEEYRVVIVEGVGVECLVV